jgi:hypothetical protein
VCDRLEAHLAERNEGRSDILRLACGIVPQEFQDGSVAKERQLSEGTV